MTSFRRSQLNVSRTRQSKTCGGDIKAKTPEAKAAIVSSRDDLYSAFSGKLSVDDIFSQGGAVANFVAAMPFLLLNRTCTGQFGPVKDNI